MKHFNFTLHSLLLLAAAQLTGCAQGTEEAPLDVSDGVPLTREIEVSKDRLVEAPVNLEVQLIDLLPGESPEAAIRRVYGNLQIVSDTSILIEAQLEEQGLLNPQGQTENDPAAQDEQLDLESGPQGGPRLGQPCFAESQWGTCATGQSCAGTPVGNICQGDGVSCCIEASNPPEQMPPEEMPPEQMPPEQMPPEEMPPEQMPPVGDDMVCNNSCFTANDEVCDDGGEGSNFDVCPMGTDCADCGPRQRGEAPRQGPPQPDPPQQDPPQQDPPQQDPPQQDPPRQDPPQQDPQQPPQQQAPQDNDPLGTRCTAQGVAGTCQNVDRCRDGAGLEPIPGHCPGDHTVQCCIPQAQPQNNTNNHDGQRPYGAGEACTAYGQRGVCGTPNDCMGGRREAGFCPGDDDIQCCLEDNASQPAPGQLPQLGQACVANGEAGVCSRVQSCAGTPTPGYCAGDNSIQCCIEGEEKLAWFAVPLVIEGASLAIALYRGYRAARLVGTVITTTRNAQAVRVGIYTGAQSIDRARRLGYAGGRTLESRIGNVVDNFYRAAALAAAAERLSDMGGMCRPDDLNAYSDGRRDSGSCSPEDHCQLANIKTQKCDQQPHSCNGIGDNQVNSITSRLRNNPSLVLPPTERELVRAWCELAQSRIDNGAECLGWRQRISEECFSGRPDPRDHASAEQQVLDAGNRCRRSMERNLCDNFLSNALMRLDIGPVDLD
ncbi:MAG: hypothetical protein ACE366_30230 [Bradymonadia bacterium]